MYKTPEKSQPSLFEEIYAALFPSGTGNVAKPLRLALGSLIIQNRFQHSGRELVGQLSENPYLQYFIGLPGYQSQTPFDASTLVWFRKRITIDMKDYLAFVKSRKHTEKKVREAVALSVFVSNLFRIQRRIFAVIFSMRYKFMACVA